MDGKPVLQVKDLKVQFATRQGLIKAVDGVTFDLHRGESLGIVGESGSGKSMTSLAIMRLVPPPNGRIVAGEILLDGENLLKKSSGEMREIRGGRVAMIFQDPMSSLNPAFTIGNQVSEAVSLHQHLKGDQLRKKVITALSLVKIPAPESRVKSFPHQMSGGMRQRVVGAIALSCEPEVLIADEPTTSLDVTVQAQYLRLLKEIQDEKQIAIILITHDLGIVARLCHRVAVMYAGRIVEIGSTEQIFDKPSHPYTMALLRSTPKLEGVSRLDSIEGEPPDPSDLPEGCRFAPRCKWAQDKCREAYPPRVQISDGHSADCWFAGELR